MSRQDKERNLRLLICSGCEHECRYVDFRAHGKRAGILPATPPEKPEERDYKREYARKRALREARRAGEPLPHGQKGLKHAGHELFKERGESTRVESENSDQWVYRSKGKVLGSLHATKMAMWLEYTQKCPSHDEKG